MNMRENSHNIINRLIKPKCKTGYKTSQVGDFVETTPFTYLSEEDVREIMKVLAKEILSQFENAINESLESKIAECFIDIEGNL